MANSQKDQNGRDSLISSLNTDGTTIVTLKANPANNALKALDASTGSDAGNHGGIALIDQNGVSAMTALSSTGDGTIIQLYADSSGNLLIDSN